MRDGPMRLSTRLGIAHGVLVALLLILLVVTLQGLLRMLGVITEIRDERLSTVDAEEDLHRSAWGIEVALRHGGVACAAGGDETMVRERILAAHAELRRVLVGGADHANERLRTGARRYDELARAALDTTTCPFLVKQATDDLRAALDEEMTDAWIERLHELHADLQEREEKARRVGTETAVSGLVMAVVAAVAAIVIARSNARSVSDPIARLASAATRIGEGDFAPIPKVAGPREVEDLWRDLERARRRLQELDELKQQFLASVSHELRSPLAPLREALSLLTDGTVGELNDRQRYVLALATRACEREVRIVEALLDMSRLRSGLPTKLDSGCDVDRVIETAIEDERDEAEQRQVKVEVICAGETPPSIEIDAALVERAVANLVRNAISVSRPGQAVRIRRYMEGGTDARIRVEVSDDGPGIDADLKPNLFRPFSAAAVRNVDRPAGIGIGLSFAREVARVHGGELTLLASDETGTTFRFELPLKGEERA
jgi:two-component system, NtrC family, sensor histidine kinase GlrK